MKRITENNIRLAIEKAREFHRQTGAAVEACNVIGEPIIYITDTGKENIYIVMV